MSSSRSRDPPSLRHSVCPTCFQESQLLLTYSKVLFLAILDTVHLAFSSHTLYYYLVGTYGKVTALQQPTM